MAQTRETQTRTDQEERTLPSRESGASDRLRRRESYEVSGGGPFSFMRRMTEDMDRMLGDIWGSARQWPALFREGGRPEWSPAIEAFQRGSEFVVRADIPGLSRDDITVEIGDDALTIRGERKYDHQEER